MFLLFGDEADSDRGRGQKFFVYGAVFIPTNSVQALHAAVEKARTDAGLKLTDSLKFASRTKPTAMAAGAHRALKKEVMRLAREVGNAKFCSYVMLHELARNQEQNELIQWGANSVLGKFNEFLEESKSHGYALLDRMPVGNSYVYLKEKFQIGNSFKDKQIRLDRILGFGHVCDGSSHMCSVADVMLGAFRYCVNEPDNIEAGKEMFPVLMSMMWKRESGGKTYVNNCGLLLRPRTVEVAKHKTEYDSLLTRLQSYLD
jgi:hypothetical protein